MELPASHPLSQKRIRNYGHNQWPELPGFQETMLRYQGEVRKLGDHLLGLLARSLDLPLDWFVPHYQLCSQSVRLLKYPPQPESAAFNQIGAGAHTDWGGVTVLAQDSRRSRSPKCEWRLGSGDADPEHVRDRSRRPHGALD